jgi:hypothetical protein
MCLYTGNWENVKRKATEENNAVVMRLTQESDIAISICL